jgi:hypothetical protein
MKPTNELRTQGTRNLMELARTVGATRFITQSFLGGYGYGDHGDAVLTEDHPFGPRGRSAGLEPTIAAMRSAEDQVLNSPDLQGMAMRYGLFYGPGRPLDTMLKMVRVGSFPFLATVVECCPGSTSPMPLRSRWRRWRMTAPAGLTTLATTNRSLSAPSSRQSPRHSVRRHRSGYTDAGYFEWHRTRLRRSTAPSGYPTAEPKRNSAGC